MSLKIKKKHNEVDMETNQMTGTNNNDALILVKLNTKEVVVAERRKMVTKKIDNILVQAFINYSSVNRDTTSKKIEKLLTDTSKGIVYTANKRFVAPKSNIGVNQEIYTEIEVGCFDKNDFMNKLENVTDGLKVEVKVSF
jgi:hypothetical protein